MRLTEGVEWAAHCAVVLSKLPPGAYLPATRLAEYHEVPPAYLAKTLSVLARAGVVESVPGRSGGFRLARRAEDVTLLDIVLAVEGNDLAFRCAEIRRRGPAPFIGGKGSPACLIASAMWRAEAAWREELASITVAEIADRVDRERLTPAARERAAEWRAAAATWPSR